MSISPIVRELPELPGCSICFEPMNGELNCAMTTPCEHTFCGRCIEEWLVDRSAGNCPECRGGLSMDALLRNRNWERAVLENNWTGENRPVPDGWVGRARIEPPAEPPAPSLTIPYIRHAIGGIRDEIGLPLTIALAVAGVTLVVGLVALGVFVEWYVVSYIIYKLSYLITAMILTPLFPGIVWSVELAATAWKVAQYMSAARILFNNAQALFRCATS